MLRTIKKSNLIWLQIILIGAFLLQPIILPARPSEIGMSVFSWDIIKNVSTNALIIAFFYLNFFVLIPKLYFTKKYVIYVATILLSLMMILSVSFVGNKIVPHKKPPMLHEINGNKPLKPEFKKPRDIEKNGSIFEKFQYFFSDNDQTFSMFTVTAFFSILLRVSNRFYQTENAKKEAEINYLLAQINPHFLFNALNSIYTLTIKEKAPNSSESLLKLSGLLRYVFSETHKNRIPLDKEIAGISDFIDLQKMRLTKMVELNFLVSGNFLGKEIAPMLILPFIENAFKHGVSTEEISEINIKIEIIENELKLLVNNTKITAIDDEIGKSGLGIANAKNRLQLLYPNQHYLKISETEKEFNVMLKISV